MENEEKEGRYIYGIIRNSDKTEFTSKGIGGRNDRVYCVTYNDISAVVSASPIIQYQARRVNMIAHQVVLEDVMKRFCVLPVRFSTISPYDNDEEIETIISNDYRRFDDMLKKMNGKKELGLKVLAIENKIYENIIDKYDNIRLLRDKLKNKPADKIHYERVKVGEMVSDALKQEKEIYKNHILDHIRPISEDVKVNDVYGDFMILNAAFLIKNEIENLFDNAICDLDKQYGHLMTFKYVGTLPPYNFVNLKIKCRGE